MEFSLTPEESFLWECARTWRTSVLPANSESLDWTKIVAVGRANRMQVLLHQVLVAAGGLELIPAESRAALDGDVDRLVSGAGRMSQALEEYLRRAAGRGIETVVHKGLSLSINIYGNPAMRPGGDIDILVRRGQVQASLEVLREMGVSSFWPNLLDDRYYARHHLHQQRSTRDLSTWFEIHWALDHPYTLLTIDYEAMMDRSTRGLLLGQPVHELSLPDLVTSLAVHLVKHAVYLPDLIDRPDLSRVILADGMLVYFLDVAEVVKQYGDMIDWAALIELARQSGTAEILGAVLRVCGDHLDAPAPAPVLAALLGVRDAVGAHGGASVLNGVRNAPRSPISKRLTRIVLRKMVEHETRTYLGLPSSRLWSFLVSPNGAFILRPIRVLDTLAYFFPGPDYLCRRYEAASTKTAVRHLFRAAGQYARLAVDTVYFTWERYRRLKALHQSASLFNRLETGG
jgi:hypothetical protein